MIIGKHFINGEWIDSESKFESKPSSGNSNSFAVGTVQNINDAVHILPQYVKTTIYKI